MLFRVIWAVVIGTAFLIAIIAEGRKDKKHRDKIQQFLMAAINEKPFSVTEYFDRMERESLKIAERKEQYLIVLWWGYDGLRLNEDGTAEWISRKPKQSQSLEQVVQNMAFSRSTELEIQRLELQLQALQIRNAINSITTPYPKYPTQCCITPYASGPYLSWNCCSIAGQSSTFT